MFSVTGSGFLSDWHDDLSDYEAVEGHAEKYHPERLDGLHIDGPYSDGETTTPYFIVNGEIYKVWRDDRLD